MNTNKCESNLIVCYLYHILLFIYIWVSEEIKFEVKTLLIPISKIIIIFILKTYHLRKLRAYVIIYE